MFKVKSDTVKISVIIPTYRPSDYLIECLESLKAQTLDKDVYEVILVLNGPEEPYKSRIQAYIDCNCEDLNICFIYIAVAGVSNARNVALEAANGDYITFIDDDDWISPDYLKELFQKASPAIVSLCYPLAFYDGENNYFSYSITREYEKNAYKGKCFFGEARRYFNGPVYKLIHRDIIGKRRIDVSFQNGEDSLFMFLISDRIGEVSFTSENAVYYRRYRQNSATTQKRSRYKIFVNIIRLICEYSRIYFTSVIGYNFLFYITRVMAAIKSLKN